MPPGFETSAGQSAEAVYAETPRSSGMYPPTTSSGVGLSGPGRGRHSRATGGRISSERRPLANTYANGKSTRLPLANSQTTEANIQFVSLV